MKLYTVFVNSTDSFSDCWEPFFKLFKTYWPNFDGEIILNTETKNFEYPGLNIKITQVALNETKKNLPYGECLIRGLNQVSTRLILYLQEDYFINAPIKENTINEFAQYMLYNNITNIRLMECANAGPWSPTNKLNLWKVDRKAKYRISLQAGLWDKNKLKTFIRPHETPWELERWGSIRERRKNEDSIYCVNRNIFNDKDGQIISYGRTGIVKGKWKKDIVQDLFWRHGIEVDYRKRGFYDPIDSKVKYKNNLIKKVISAIRSLI